MELSTERARRSGPRPRASARERAARLPRARSARASTTRVPRRCIPSSDTSPLMASRTRRRPDRRRRPLRHRRRAATCRPSCPGKTLRDPRGARRDRRHLGPVPLPGHPLGLRHVHARLPLPAVDASAKAIADGPSILQLHPRHRARVRRRRATSASATASCAPSGRRDDARWTVERRAHRHRRDGRASPAASCSCCTGYYRYDEGYTPDVRGRRALRGPDRPPAALARGPRLRGQARRRDRQRRDRGDARAGDGRAGRARDDAAALADLRRLAARRRTRSPTSLRRVLPPKARLRDRALEERAADDGDLPAQPPARRELDRSGCIRKGVERAAARRATTSTRTSRRATTRGTSGSAWCPTATCSRRSATAARRSSPTAIETFTENGHPAGVGRRARGRPRRHRHRAEPAAARRHRARGRRRARSSCSETVGYKGMMLSGVPELRVRARLHERLVDAQVRPHLRVRLPAAQPHGRARLRALRRRARRDPSVPTRAVHRLQRPATCCARSTQLPEAGLDARRGGCTRTTSAT